MLLRSQHPNKRAEDCGESVPPIWASILNELVFLEHSSSDARNYTVLHYLGMLGQISLLREFLGSCMCNLQLMNSIQS